MSVRVWGGFGYWLSILCAGCVGGATPWHETVSSPDGSVTFSMSLKRDGWRGDCLQYAAAFRGEPVVLESALGLTLQDGEIRCGLEVASVEKQAASSQWTTRFGERATVPDVFRSMSVDFREKGSSDRTLRLDVRVYDGGVAFRQVLDEKEEGSRPTLKGELTAFRLPEGTRAWAAYGMEEPYEEVDVKDVGPKCEWPLTLRYPGHLASILEVGNFDHPRMRLAGNSDSVLRTEWFGTLSGESPLATPWRVILMGKTPGELLERNYIPLNLSPPSAIDDTWVRPGKAMRSTSLTTAAGMRVVDFAVARNLQYVHFDAGWYGPERDRASDARSVHPTVDLDLQTVIAYAAERGIGVLLYVNRIALESQLDELLPLYAQWGVKGIKFGFVGNDSQKERRWLHQAVEKAAQHGLIVDIHDHYRPTGFSRTYPNLLTQEGVRGNEQFPTARHNATLPFTRALAGAADYTIVYESERLQTTRAHQLALSVVGFSPLQFLYWYNGPSSYKGEPEIEFFDRVHTVWDDTRVLEGRIGEVASIARRRGAEWFVGTITNEEARKVVLPLGFLDENTTYVVHVFADDIEKLPQGVTVSRHLATRNSELTAALAASGGHAAMLVPATQEDLERYPPLPSE